MKITTLQYIAELYQYVISIYILQPQYVYVFYTHIMFWYIRIMIFLCTYVVQQRAGRSPCPQSAWCTCALGLTFWIKSNVVSYILCMAFSGNHMNTSISSVHAQEKSDIDRKRYRLWRGPHLQHISLPYQNTCFRFDFIALFGTFKSYFCRWFDHFRKQSMRHFIWVRDLSAVFDGVDP